MDILVRAELMLKEMQAASSLEAHWRAYCDDNKDRMMATFRELLLFAGRHVGDAP